MVKRYCLDCGGECSGVTAAQKCPFCGSGNMSDSPVVTISSNQVEKTWMELSDEKFDSIDDAISYIFSEYGTEVIVKDKIFINLLCDYAPSLPYDRKLIRLAMETGVYADIYNAGCSDEISRTVEINKAVSKLCDTLFMENAQAVRAVNLIAKHLGFSAPVSAPAEESPAEITERIAPSYDKEKIPGRWDKVNFGRYPYYENGDVAPIEWEVLDVNGDEVLLWTTKCIDSRCYHPMRDQRPGWEDCDLRYWLRMNFVPEAFDETEQNAIIVSTSGMSTNPRSKRTNGGDVEDMVFIISNEQLDKYRVNRQQLICEATPYAKAKGIYCDNNSMQASWWLRTPGYGVFSEMFVSNNGRRDELGNTVDYANYGVRPVIRVKWSLLV